LLLLAASATPGAEVAGTVVDALSGAPVHGATVQLRKEEGKSESPAYTATSDTQGRFSIAEVAPGLYRATFQVEKYTELRYDHPARQPFSVGAGTDRIRLHADLQPYAKVSGRVTSPAGKPLDGITLELTRVTGSVKNISRTKDGGSFAYERLYPGVWLLSAKAPPSLPPPPPFEGHAMVWARTFFPGTADRSAAERIVLRPGTVLSGFDIRLRATPARTISGVVLDSDLRPAPNVHLQLIERGAPGLDPEAQTKTNADGAFVFPSAYDGDWYLRAETKRGGVDLNGFDSLTIAGRDASRLSIALTAPFTVTGFIDRDEPRNSAGERKVTAVYLIPSDGHHSRHASAFHEQNGSFTIQNVHRGSYAVHPAGYLPGYYMDRVMLGDRDITGQHVELNETSPPLRVIYKANAGRMQGTVDKGEGLKVALVPQDEALLDIQYIRTSSCGADGRFNIDSIRPGAYYAFAFDKVELDMLEQPAFIRALAARATRVEVKHGEMVTLELRPQPWPEY
jgi:5-hydroxyisourate hydrolase-like protein (transthyretin family)